MFIQSKYNIDEQRIVNNWEDFEVKVSIVCTTYNHELYIKDAIEGFLNQKTKFAFEVIIHDDASTDNTKNIIIEYEKKYPNLINAIFQNENQYTKSINIFQKYIYPNIKGKYIALCEGDDYWIDINKLQKQYDALEKNKSCDICFHPAKAIKEDGSSKVINFYCKTEKIFPVEEVILGDGGFMPTTSLFYRKEVSKNISDFHNRYGKFYVVDVMIQIIASIRGGALYIPIIGAIYRVMSIGSWSSRMNSDIDYSIKFIKQSIIWNEKLNEYTKLKYKKYFIIKIKNNIKEILTIPYIKKEDRKILMQMYSKYVTITSMEYINIIYALRFIKSNIKTKIKKIINER